MSSTLFHALDAAYIILDKVDDFLVQGLLSIDVLSLTDNNANEFLTPEAACSKLD